MVRITREEFAKALDTDWREIYYVPKGADRTHRGRPLCFEEYVWGLGNQPFIEIEGELVE